ncbi:MAG: hypothetical protein SVW57_12900, partial [Thermodesulfobacteriota bacterium]|nr:hypothetical protein [Thermodesulfobacteriota bacterium]
MDREVLYEELTQRILKKLEHIPFYVLEDGDSIHIGEGYDELISTSKVYLHVAKQKGAFVKRCPGTKYHICCGYHILNVGMNCNFDCSYCFLQFYINSPVTTLYTNLGDLAHEVDQYLENSSEHILRFGTGEFTDSLSLDNVTDLSRDLLALFSHRQCIVELKTKSTNVKNLVSDTANPNFVISWSVNPERIIRDEEHYTASLKERLRAARFCQEAGYLVGLHFDPIIHYPGWEEDYQGVVDDIY